MKRRRRIRRVFGLLLSLVLTLGSITGNVVFASESNESEIVEVEPVYIRELTGQEVHGNSYVTWDYYYYTFSLPSAGELTVNSDLTNGGYAYWFLYDESEEEIWGGNNDESLSILLTGGTYYIAIACQDFELLFESANVSFEESQGGSNNDEDTATEIDLNTEYTGLIAYNDYIDYYKFVLSSDATINLTMVSETEASYWYIFDDGLNEIASEYITYARTNTTRSYSADLTAGAYYFMVCRSSGEEKYIYHTGLYSFEIAMDDSDSGSTDVSSSSGISSSKKTSIASYTVSLSKTSYTYDGKVKKPSVTVKNGSKTLAASNYKVTYASGRKKIGKYRVTITGTGNYTGTITKYFKIVPKKVTLKSATKSTVKKKLTVKWQKVSGSITKYQIRYRVKGTAKWKTKIVSASKTNVTLSKLKSGKKYQVQVRAYKTVNGTKYYGSWSNTKTVKVK